MQAPDWLMYLLLALEICLYVTRAGLLASWQLDFSECVEEDSDNCTDILADDATSLNWVMVDLVSNNVYSVAIGVAGAIVAHMHLKRLTAATKTVALGVNVIAFLLNVTCLGYAAKMYTMEYNDENENRLDDVSRETALGLLSIIQACLTFIFIVLMKVNKPHVSANADSDNAAEFGRKLFVGLVLTLNLLWCVVLWGLAGDVYNTRQDCHVESVDAGRKKCVDYRTEGSNPVSEFLDNIAIITTSFVAGASLMTVLVLRALDIGGNLKVQGYVALSLNIIAICVSLLPFGLAGRMFDYGQRDGDGDLERESSAAGLGGTAFIQPAILVLLIIAIATSQLGIKFHAPPTLLPMIVVLLAIVNLALHMTRVAMGGRNLQFYFDDEEDGTSRFRDENKLFFTALSVTHTAIVGGLVGLGACVVAIMGVFAQTAESIHSAFGVTLMAAGLAIAGAGFAAQMIDTGTSYEGDFELEPTDFGFDLSLVSIFQLLVALPLPFLIWLLIPDEEEVALTSTGQAKWESRDDQQDTRVELQQK